MIISDNQYIQNALKNGISTNTERFFWKKFDNADEEHVSSMRGHLSRREMIQLKERVDEIVNGYYLLTKGSIMTKEQKELSKVMYIYNYILENVMYSQCQFAGNSSNVYGGNPHKNSIYGALVEHEAVCSGISEAIDCLCKVMDVESAKLLSNPEDAWGGGHAYNTVKIGNNWYQLDAALEIGLNPGHKIRGDKWKDRSFLVPFSTQHRKSSVPNVSDCTTTYPRELINQMKKRLQDRGLNFTYQQSSSIIHKDMESALTSFLIKRVGRINVGMIQNFSRSMDSSFKITRRDGIYVAERNQYVEKVDRLYNMNNQEISELYSNGDSRFAVKTIHRNRISGFTILRNNGEIERRIPSQY